MSDTGEFSFYERLPRLEGIQRDEGLEGGADLGREGVRE
jgi:hypothetical protein